MHLFKRYYLLGSVLIAFIIPLITFTTYVELSPTSDVVSEGSILISEGVTSSSFDWETLLWIIYGLGVLIFSIKFLMNLFHLIRRIQQNPKLKNSNYIQVLLRDRLAPHTFFNYLFFNKEAFIAKQIPSEVIVHEEAHANQLHSLDILFMEVLQIMFWFNPLIYLAKNAIKLNHEFLADREVINKGIETSNYQETLLAFSSNAQSSKLANAFNYSLIKKRFTVMKTQTSKRTIWSKGLLLLPLLAILLFSFSEKAVEIKETINPESIDLFHGNIPDKKLKLHVEKERIIVNGTISNLKDFVKIMNQVTSDWTKEDFNLHGLEIKVADNVENTFINKINAEFRKTNLAKTLKMSSPYIPLKKSISSQDIATKKMVKEYNALAKKYNEMAPGELRVKRNELERMRYIYELMSPEQRSKAEKFPVRIPPAPEAPRAPMAPHAKHAVHPAEGRVPPPAPPIEIEVIEHDGDFEMMPPPPPPVPSEHMKELAAKGAIFYYEGKEISGKDAIKIARDNKEINILIRDHDSKKPIVKLSKDPIQLD
ncbi:M56 family metallopeptidase [Gillisia marina]|uniref:M56 family metallopeptidase n=1 Tax=Gillisia marina TaxID=1167637 RepID=UPI00031E4E93|nr:M56 family metallopeptidase [Gillisia marina]